MQSSTEQGKPGCEFNPLIPDASLGAPETVSVCTVGPSLPGPGTDSGSTKSGSRGKGEKTQTSEKYLHSNGGGVVAARARNQVPARDRGSVANRNLEQSAARVSNNPHRMSMLRSRSTDSFLKADPLSGRKFTEQKHSAYSSSTTVPSESESPKDCSLHEHGSSSRGSKDERPPTPTSPLSATQYKDPEEYSSFQDTQYYGFGRDVSVEDRDSLPNNWVSTPRSPGWGSWGREVQCVGKEFGDPSHGDGKIAHLDTHEGLMGSSGHHHWQDHGQPQWQDSESYMVKQLGQGAYTYGSSSIGSAACQDGFVGPNYQEECSVSAEETSDLPKRERGGISTHKQFC